MMLAMPYVLCKDRVLDIFVLVFLDMPFDAIGAIQWIKASLRSNESKVINHASEGTLEI
jgi:hypothetical protein